MLEGSELKTDQGIHLLSQISALRVDPGLDLDHTSALNEEVFNTIPGLCLYTW